jgi:hypothetical protein
MICGYNAAFEWALVENKITINAIAQKFVNRFIDERRGELVRNCFIIGSCVLIREVFRWIDLLS